MIKITAERAELALMITMGTLALIASAMWLTY
jgi:hypothetical protein